MLASLNGHTESQKVLLEAGADVSIQAEVYTYSIVTEMLLCTLYTCIVSHAHYCIQDGWTALMWASHNGHTESLKVLLEAGADFSIQTKVRNTALSCDRELHLYTYTS